MLAGAPPLVRALAVAWTALQVGACAEPQWARQSWPSEIDGQYAQPEGHAEAWGLRLSARAITWEPEGIVVELVLVREGELALVLEPGHVFLAYDGLEYAPVFVDASQETIVLVAGEERVIELRYVLGRAMTGRGRGCACEGCGASRSWLRSWQSWSCRRCPLGLGRLGEVGSPVRRRPAPVHDGVDLATLRSSPAASRSWHDKTGSNTSATRARLRRLFMAGLREDHA